MGHFTLRRLAAVALLSVSASAARAQTGGLGIGTTTPNVSAALDITSTTKGLLLPRLTQAQRDAIATPPGGLLIFQTDNTPGLYAYSGSAWVLLAADNLGNHTATQNLDLGANQLVGNGGTQGLSITNGGNVGIGTTSPTQKLHVSGNATVTSTLSIGANNTVNPLSVTGTAPITALLQSGNTTGTRVNLTNTSTGATTWSLISTGSTASEGVGKLLINDVTGPRLTLDGSGRMGVGLTSPSALLDVNGSTRLRGLTTAGVVTTDASGNLSSVTSTSLADNLGNHNATTGISLSDNDIYFRGTSSGDTNHGLGYYGPSKQWNGLSLDGPVLYGWSGGILGTNSGGVKRTALLWNSAGNVGIGTTSPAYRLHVVGGDTRIAAAGTQQSLFGIDRLVGFDDLRFYGDDAGTTELMRLQSNGYLGIGTPSPSALLDVNGATRLRGLTTAGVVTTDASGNLSSATAASLDATTASNGLTRTGTAVTLGGTLSQNTTVALAGNSLALSNAPSQTITQAATTFIAYVTNSPGMGQSFTLPAGATVTKVDVYGDGGSGAFTFYQGAPGSTVLTTQPVTYNTGQALTSITLTTPVTVGAAGTYSFSTGSNNTFAVSNTNPYAGGILYDGTNAATSLDMKFVLYYTTPGTALYVDNGGGVGIGTSAPAATLHVAGTGSTVLLEGLSGTGTRVVTTDASGNLGSTPAASLDPTTASNGLTKTGSDFTLGGTLTGATTIGTTAVNPLTVNGAGAVNVGTGTGTTTLGNTSAATALRGSSIALTGTVTSANSLNVNGSLNANSGLNASSANITGTTTINSAGAATTLIGGGTANVFVRGVITVSGPTTINANTDITGTTNLGTTNLTGTASINTSGTAATSIGTGASAGTVTIGRSGGTVTLGNLTGATTRMVTADAAGNLSTATLPTGGTITASNGLTLTGSNVTLGGPLTGATTIANGGNNLSVTGTGNVGIGTSSPTARLHIGGTVAIDGNNALEFGAGVSGKETNAGKIGYNAFGSGALDLVGAGTTNTNRQVKIWAEGGTTLAGPLTAGGKVDLSTNALVGNGGTTGLTISSAGAVTVGNLTGATTRMVTANSAGVLSTQALPADTDAQTLSVSGGNLSISNGNSVPLASLADNLGNHTATTTLNLNGNRLSGGTGANIGIPGGQTLEFGAGVSGKEANAGKIGYQTFGGTDLDIVGAGTTTADRRIKLWAEGGLEVSGPSYLTGNVGIGALNPTYRLQVVGGDTRLGATGGESNLFGIDKIVGLNDLRFYTDDAGTTERMQISSGGNVGIGTTNPTSTLHVAGSEAGAYLTTGSATSFTLTSAHRTVRRFGTCATITVPQASTCPGRLYTIINSNGQGAFTLTVTGGGSVYDDIANQTFSGTNAFPAATRLTIQSDGSGWIVVAR